MQVSQQILKLIVRKRGGGHHISSAQNHRRKALVCGWRARGHFVFFRDCLQPRAVQGMRSGWVVTACAMGLVHLCSASFLRCPLRRGLGRRQRTATSDCSRQPRDGENKRAERRIRTGLHLVMMIPLYSAAAIASAILSMASPSASLPGLCPFTIIENAMVFPLAAVR